MHPRLSENGLGFPEPSPMRDSVRGQQSESCKIPPLHLQPMYWQYVTCLTMIILSLARWCHEGHELREDTASRFQWGLSVVAVVKATGFPSNLKYHVWFPDRQSVCVIDLCLHTVVGHRSNLHGIGKSSLINLSHFVYKWSFLNFFQNRRFLRINLLQSSGVFHQI